MIIKGKVVFTYTLYNLKSFRTISKTLRLSQKSKLSFCSRLRILYISFQVKNQKRIPGWHGKVRLQKFWNTFQKHLHKIKKYDILYFYNLKGKVAELADARDLKSLGRKAVRVRFPPFPPPKFIKRRYQLQSLITKTCFF